jgi:PAS domain S-box-containing protein
MKLIPPILLVDDDPDDRDLASLVLTGAFGEIALEPVGDAGVLTRALASQRFGMVITEFQLDWIDGAEVVRLAREMRPDCAVVMFTEVLSEQMVDDAIRLGVDAFVPKSSAGFSKLPLAVRTALYRARRRAMDMAKEAPYKRVFDGLPIGVFVATSGGEVLECNPAFAEALGYDSPEKLAGRSMTRFFADREAAEQWRSSIASAGDLELLEAQLRRSDGTSLWVRLKVVSVSSESAGVRQLLGIVELIGADRAELEALTLRSEELARSTEDLEQMAYVVSHDLQQPLNVVARFLDLVLERDGDRLSESGREYVDHAISGAANLQRMVDGVLRFARVDSSEQQLEAVDCNRVLERALHLLEEDIAKNDAEITSDELPTVIADQGQLEQLFQNLLSNALKFKNERAPRLHISADEQKDEWLLGFRDNGIGLDPQAADRVFLMFQRLHTQQEYPGTGIGLAVCKRIVTRHGGRIWVESQPGEGSTFFVALPKRVSPSVRGNST